MIKVFVAQHVTEAYLLKGLLENEGIESEVRGEALFGTRGAIPLGEALPEVWVSEDRAAEAQDVVRRFATEAASVERVWPWRCRSCGETVEGQFTACWQCGAERPAAD